MIYMSLSMFFIICLHLNVIYLDYKKYNSFKLAINKNKNMTKFVGVVLFIYYLYMVNYDYNNPDLYGNIKPFLFWIVCGIVFLLIYIKDKFWSNRK